jgi:hypothetical protein
MKTEDRVFSVGGICCLGFFDQVPVAAALWDNGPF